VNSSKRISTWIGSPPERGDARRMERGPCARAVTLGAVLVVLQGCAALQTWHLWPGSATAVAPPLSPSAQDVPKPPAVPEPAASAGAGDLPSGAAEDARKAAAAPARRAPGGAAPAVLATTQVGYYMDVLQGRLTQDVGRDGNIQRRGDRIIIVLPVSFEADGVQISAAGRQLLRRVASILTEYRLTAVGMQMRGVDADPRGENTRLSSDRMMVLSHCLTDAGVAGRRIESNATAAALETAAASASAGPQVELQLTPLGGSP
jgi:outer membrane protein OmpA-like peptidoglycan-associated protein